MAYLYHVNMCLLIKKKSCRIDSLDMSRGTTKVVLCDDQRKALVVTATPTNNEASVAVSVMKFWFSFVIVFARQNWQFLI